MKRIKKAATLIVTTIVLSFVTITTAVFSVIYFRYNQMNFSYHSNDIEKIQLYQNINVAYEHFLKDTVVEYNGISKKLRTEWLVNDTGLSIEGTLSANFSTFIANFNMNNIDRTSFNLTIHGSNNTIKSTIDLVDDVYQLNFINIEARD